MTRNQTSRFDKETPEKQQMIKRPAEDDAEASSSAKRPKPPPAAPTAWWEHEAIKYSLLHVRMEQATLYDPKKQRFDRCRGFHDELCEPAVFDHDEESTARIARPLHTIPEPRSHLELLMNISLNVLHLKVLSSDVGFPIQVFGTVLVRDDLDFKCIYLFQRDRDNCQVISSPDEMLALTGPYYRGPVDSTIFYFEIDLKIKGEEQAMDRIFSRSLEYQHYPLGESQTKKKQVSSWLSTLELAYRIVHYAVEATVGINILRGPQEFYGRLTACTSEDTNEMVLYDSERWGSTKVGANGSVALPRPLIVLREDEDLVLEVCVFGHGRKAKPKTTILTVEHDDKLFDVKLGRYQLQVTVSWAYYSC